MFLEDYGKWVELVDDRDQSHWIAIEDLPFVNLRGVKLIREYDSGEISGKCWLTYSEKDNVVNRSTFVVDKEEEVNNAVMSALEHSSRLGGNFAAVGCLQKPQKD